jgi:hypothetical protein
MTKKKIPKQNLLDQIKSGKPVTLIDLKANDVSGAALDLATWGACIAFSYSLIPEDKVANWMANHPLESAAIALPTFFLGPVGAVWAQGMIGDVAKAQTIAQRTTNLKRIEFSILIGTLIAAGIKYGLFSDLISAVSSLGKGMGLFL